MIKIVETEAGNRYRVRSVSTGEPNTKHEDRPAAERAAFEHIAGAIEKAIQRAALLVHATQTAAGDEALAFDLQLGAPDLAAEVWSALYSIKADLATLSTAIDRSLPVGHVPLICTACEGTFSVEESRAGIYQDGYSDCCCPHCNLTDRVRAADPSYKPPGRPCHECGAYAVGDACMNGHELAEVPEASR